MTNLPLSFIPLAPKESLHVYLNGIHQQQDVDWSYDATFNRVTTLSPMDVRSGDRLEARYAHQGVFQDDLPGTYVTRNYGGSFSNTTATLSTYAHTAGNLLVGMFGANSADIAASPGDGWIPAGPATYNGSGNVVRWFYKVGSGSTSSVSPALSGLTWYCWTMFEFGGGLSSVSDIVTQVGSGLSHTVPAIGSSGRLLHSFAIAPGNSGYSISPWPKTGDTLITSTSWGNSNDFWHSTGIGNNGASSHTASTSIESIASTLALS